MTEEKRRKYVPPLAGMAQYERLREEASNVMPEIDLPQAEQRTRGITFLKCRKQLCTRAEPRNAGLSFTEMQKVALHPADQQIQEINHSGIQRTDPYQAGEQCRKVLQANTEMPEQKTADMEGKHLAAIKTEAGRPEILQYQNPLTEKQRILNQRRNGRVPAIGMLWIP